jgi:hypothetical protein
MADILTHLISADESLERLNADINRIIKSNRNIFNLGAQGPDVFFYYKVFPWQKTNNIDKTGTLLHSEKTEDFLVNAAKYLKNQVLSDPMEFYRKTKKDSDLHRQFAYIAGFLTHYALDTLSHPFIFYFSGKDGGYNHKYFECIIDTLLSDIYNAKKVRLHKTGHAIKLSAEDRYVVSDYISKIIYVTYHKNIDRRDIQIAIKDMKRVMQAMYDPKNIKRGSFKVVDRLSKAQGKIATATYPAKLDHKIDYLNINHTTWLHPCDDQETHTESFIDLLKQAREYSASLIDNLALYITHHISESEFRALIGNKMYDTGREASLSQEMLFENPIVDYMKTYKIKSPKA